MVLFLSFLTLLFAHPMHLSVSEVNYNARTASIEVSHKIFYDDLETALQGEYNLKLRLNSPQEHARSEEYIARYLQKYFALEANGKPASLRYVGREYDNDAVWVYVEAPLSGAPASFRIRNQILLAQFEDQNNLVHLRSGDNKKSLRFQNGEEVQHVNWK